MEKFQTLPLIGSDVKKMGGSLLFVTHLKRLPRDVYCILHYSWNRSKSRFDLFLINIAEEVGVEGGYVERVLELII